MEGGGGMMGGGKKRRGRGERGFWGGERERT